MATFAEKKWGNCNNAVAYQFNFIQFCYGYETDCYDDYYSLCDKCGYAINQKKTTNSLKVVFRKKITIY